MDDMTQRLPCTPLDTIGSFWPAARPEERLPGRLTFDPTDGGRLEVLGSFHDSQEVLARAPAEADGSVSVGVATLLGFDSPAIRILGDTTDGPVTLERCLPTQLQMGGGTSQSTYHIPLVLSGTHIPDGEPLLFQKAEFGIPHFVRWSRTSGLSPSLIVHDASRRLEEIRITYTPLLEATVELPHGQLLLHLPYRFHGDHIVESSIEQACTFELRFADPGGVVDALEAHHALQALLSIAVGTPVRVAETRVQSAGGPWLRLHTRGVGAGAHSSGVPKLDRSDVLFTYTDLGGLKGVGRWLTMSKKFWAAIAPLMSRWYAPDLYDELQFFSMVTAAEAFYRIRVQTRKREPLERMLKRLADLAGLPFQSMLGDVDGWATRVVRTRNEHVVHRGLGGEPDGESLYWLTGAVYVLVVLCLLRECDVPEENLPKSQTCPLMATISRKLTKMGSA